jgi:Tfp pilus assembly protein PilF
LFSFCFFLFLFVGSQAQYDVSRINKKAVAAYNLALEKAQDGKYNESIVALQEAIQKDANYIDAYLSLAGIYGQLKNHGQSVIHYEKALDWTAITQSEYRLPYSINLAGPWPVPKCLGNDKCITS